MRSSIGSLSDRRISNGTLPSSAAAHAFLRSTIIACASGPSGAAAGAADRSCLSHHQRRGYDTSGGDYLHTETLEGAKTFALVAGHFHKPPSHALARIPGPTKLLRRGPGPSLTLITSNKRLGSWNRKRSRSFVERFFRSAIDTADGPTTWRRTMLQSRIIKSSTRPTSIRTLRGAMAPVLGLRANRRVRVTAARARNEVAGNRDIQFGSETAALVSN